MVRIMDSKKIDLQHEIPLLIFALAAMGFSVRQLIEIDSYVALFFATLIMFFGLMAAILGLVKYWRHN